MAVKDLIAEHAELTAKVASLRERVKAGLWGAAPANRLRAWEQEIFEAEDRMAAIEKTRTWQRGPGGDEDGPETEQELEP